MKQRIAQIAFLLVFAVSIASSGKECSPKDGKFDCFDPKELNGNFTVIYCYGRHFCSGLKNLGCKYTIRPKKEESYVIAYAYNEKCGKYEEAKAKVKFTGPGQYTIGSFLGVPEGNYRAKITDDYLIEYACYPCEKGESCESSWISSRKGGKLSECCLKRLKEDLKICGLDFSKYRECCC